MAKRNETVAADIATAMAPLALNPNMEFIIRLGKKSGDIRTRVLRLGDFPQNAIEFLLAYGVQQKFIDATAKDAGTSLDEREAALDKMIEKFKAGEIGRVRAEAADPVLHEARIIVRSKLPKEKRDKLKAMEEGEANAKLDALLALPGNAWVMEEAKKRVAAKRAAASVAVDTGDL